MLEDHEFIVIAVEHYNTLGVIRSLGEKGIRPIYIAIKNKAKVASTSKYIKECIYVNSPEEGFNVLLNKFGNETDSNKLPFVYTIDDKTNALLDKNYDLLINRFIFFNAGSPNRIDYYMNKYNILKIASKYGLNTLKSCVCRKGEIPKDINYPIITKSISPIVGGWKSDVHICQDEKDLLEAYKTIKADRVLIQEYLDKKNEYTFEGFSIDRGKQMFAAVAVSYPYLISGYYSPYMNITNMDNDDVFKKMCEVIKEIGFEGIFETDFLVSKDDKLYFSEINFRNSTWSYAATIAGMNLPYLWAKATLENKIDNDFYKKITKPFMAMIEPIDFQKRVIEQKYDIKKWLNDLQSCKCPYYYGKGDDLEPFYEMILYNNVLR